MHWEDRGPSTHAHSHSQLGRQEGPIDPVPALRASLDPHPGVHGDGVSAQEVLREKISWSFSGHWQLTWCFCEFPACQAREASSSIQLFPTHQELKAVLMLVARHCVQDWGLETGVIPGQPPRGEDVNVKSH